MLDGGSWNVLVTSDAISFEAKRGRGACCPCDSACPRRALQPRGSTPKRATSASVAHSSRRAGCRRSARRCGSSCSPARFTATTVTFAGSAANSSNTWRHPPHGDDGGDVSVHTATASRPRAPELTAAAIALRSAHTDSGYDAFSTFAPSNVCPPICTAAPTANFEYGAYAP